MGLGHLRRTHNIAREIVNQAQNIEVLVLADSPVAPFFVPFRGIRYRKLPTLLKTGHSSWRVIDEDGNGHENGDVENALHNRAATILDTVRTFRPDVILVDHMPVGAAGELRPTLDAVQGMAQRPKLVLGLRDILDRPERIRRTWRELDAYSYLRLYDQVLIYGCREIFDADDSYGLTPWARCVKYSHYVVNDSRASKESGAKPKPYVLVMGGGGADAFPVASAFLDAWRSLRDCGLEAMILTGPNMCAEERAKLVKRAAGLGVRVPEGKVDAIPWIRGATAVVTMAGYNSMCEVLRWGRPALVVPRPGPSDEQRMRARHFEEQGIARVLDPEDLSGTSLAGMLRALLRAEGVPNLENIPALDGAERAARTILSTMREPAEEQTAAQIVTRASR